jgi:hypothetical protein
MTWTWDQSAGELRHDGAFVAKGYSGAASGKNSPSMQAAKDVGPIPRGKWRMTGVVDSPHTGPFTIDLAPQPGTDTCGRGDFRIHGDSIADPGSASHGCIILPRVTRQRIWASGDRNLEVIE